MSLRQSLNTSEIFGGLRGLLGRARLSLIETLALILALVLPERLPFITLRKFNRWDRNLLPCRLVNWK